MQNIRQNLFFSFLFYGISVPFAASVLDPNGGILLSPMFADAAMALSSLTVVLNAQRPNPTRLSITSSAQPFCPMFKAPSLPDRQQTASSQQKWETE